MSFSGTNLARDFLRYCLATDIEFACVSLLVGDVMLLTLPFTKFPMSASLFSNARVWYVLFDLSFFSLPGDWGGLAWKSSSYSSGLGDGGLMVELICRRPSRAMLLWFTILPWLLSSWGKFASNPNTSRWLDLRDSSGPYDYSSSWTWLMSFSYWYVFKCILVLFLLTHGLWASMGCSWRPWSGPNGC